MFGGAATRFFYDRAGRPTRTVHPDGGEESKEYDLNGNPVLTTALTGLRTRLEYDAANRAVLAVADLNGDGAFDAGPGSPDAATRTAYDAVGNPVRVTDPEGAVADTEYDAFGRPTRVTGPPVPD